MDVRMDVRTFTVDVDGIGAFTFSHRTMRDELRIGAEYSRLTEGVATPTPWLASFAEMVAALKTLTAEAPSGWDIDAMDPFEASSYSQILSAYNALRGAEDSFRGRPAKTGEGGGEASGQDHRVLVSQEVQPAAH